MIGKNFEYSTGKVQSVGTSFDFNYFIKKIQIMNVRFSSIACACLLAATGASFASEVAPLMDSKSCDPPKYPRAALMNEETGTVSMGFLIGTDGAVVESKVEKSSGSKSLDKAALSSLSQCKFKPGTKDGKPDKLWAKVDFVWKLE
jgi:protein TonB